MPVGINNDTIISNIKFVFENFSKYMISFLKDGQLPMELPSLKIENNYNCNGSYYQNINQFVLHDLNLALDDGVLRRIHAHYLLHAQVINESRKFYQDRFNSEIEKNSRGGVAGAIESGLADYFSCIFDKDPKIGENGYKDCMELYGITDQPFLRTLENNDKFYEIPAEGSQFIPLGNIWGATFWEINKVISDDGVTNSKLIKFWVDMWSEYPDYKNWTNQGAYTVFSRILDKELNMIQKERITAIFLKRNLN